jgi:RNA polymerase sigma-70 factor (ECF subfamily)
MSVGTQMSACQTDLTMRGLSTMRSHNNHVSQLIQAAQRGDTGILEQLLEGYRDYLRLMARTSLGKCLRGKSDPSDLAQESMLRAYRNFHQFRGHSEAELAAWLRSILAQNLADVARRFRRAGRLISLERPLHDIVEQSSRDCDSLLVDRGPSPSTAAMDRDSGVVLSEALADLRDDHREVILLRSLEQLDWEEVARRMDRSVDAVRMLWARALKHLRPKIEKRL